MPLALVLETQPGDDLLACPAMLHELSQSGFDICSLLLERNGARHRQVASGIHSELGFALVEPSDEISVRPPDPQALEAVIGEAIGAFTPALLVSPYIHEGDEAYRAVAKAARAAIEDCAQKSGEGPVWWMYSRGTLPEANLHFPLNDFDEIGKAAGDAGASYLRRAGVVGSLHGADLAEEVLEVQLFSDRRWHPGPRRVFAPQLPLPFASHASPDLREWLEAPTPLT